MAVVRLPGLPMAGGLPVEERQGRGADHGGSLPRARARRAEGDLGNGRGEAARGQATRRSDTQNN